MKMVQRHLQETTMPSCFVTADVLHLPLILFRFIYETKKQTDSVSEEIMRNTTLGLDNMNIYFITFCRFEVQGVIL